jgi:hypothetical protein
MQLSNEATTNYIQGAKNSHERRTRLQVPVHRRTFRRGFGTFFGRRPVGAPLYVMDTLPSPPMPSAPPKAFPHLAPRLTMSQQFNLQSSMPQTTRPTPLYPQSTLQRSGRSREWACQSWPLPKKFGICSNQKRRAPTNVLFVCCAWSFLPLVLCNYLYD